MHTLTRQLAHLLQTQRVATLATLDASGLPQQSLVPFAIDTEAPALVILVSALAAHTAALSREPIASLLVHEAAPRDGPVHALHRVSVQTSARLLDPADPQVPRLRQLYLQRFADARPITELGDFRFVLLQPQSARQVAGFGAARSLDAGELDQALVLAGTASDQPGA